MRDDGDGLGVPACRSCSTNGAELVVVAAVFGLALGVAGGFKAGVDVVGGVVADA